MPGSTSNRTRPHSGKYCYGKTPVQTFLDSVSLAREKMLDRNFPSAPEPERSPAQRSAGGGAASVYGPLNFNPDVRSSLSYYT
jgi:hypothetical protein